MNDNDEMACQLKDAEDALKDAERDFSENSYRAGTQNAQICIELCAKAIISYYCEPEWTHDPGGQLKRIVNENKEELGQKLGAEMLNNLFTLAQDDTDAWPWHGVSVYGVVREGRRIPAVEACTKQVAEDLLVRARRSLGTANKFLRGIS